MTGTIARRRCIIVNQPNILSVYFFRARPRRVADNFTVNFTEMLAHAHAKGTRPLFYSSAAWAMGTRLNFSHHCHQFYVAIYTTSNDVTRNYFPYRQLDYSVLGLVRCRMNAASGCGRCICAYVPRIMYIQMYRSHPASNKTPSSICAYM